MGDRCRGRPERSCSGQWLYRRLHHIHTGRGQRVRTAGPDPFVNGVGAGSCGETRFLIKVVSSTEARVETPFVPVVPGDVGV